MHGIVHANCVVQKVRFSASNLFPSSACTDDTAMDLSKNGSSGVPVACQLEYTPSLKQKRGHTKNKKL